MQRQDILSRMIAFVTGVALTMAVTFTAEPLLGQDSLLITPIIVSGYFIAGTILSFYSSDKKWQLAFWLVAFWLLLLFASSLLLTGDLLFGDRSIPLKPRREFGNIIEHAIVVAAGFCGIIFGRAIKRRSTNGSSSVGYSGETR